MKGKNNIFLEGEEGHPQQLFARATFSKSIFICKGWILKKKILERRGLRGGYDEKTRRMWLGRDIVVLGLLPLVQIMISFKLFSTVVLSQFLSSWENSVDVFTDV